MYRMSEVTAMKNAYLKHELGQIDLNLKCYFERICTIVTHFVGRTWKQPESYVDHSMMKDLNLPVRSYNGPRVQTCHPECYV
jgi:hypothetical protein